MKELFNFNLSVRMLNQFSQEHILKGHPYGVFLKEDVAYFIKILKEMFEERKPYEVIYKELIKLVGKDLI